MWVRKQSSCKGRLKRSARAVQLFGRLAVLETHAFEILGASLLPRGVGFDSFSTLGIWHFWIFTHFHPLPLFFHTFLLISTTSTLF